MIETLFIAFVAGVVLFLVLIAKHVDDRIDRLEEQIQQLKEIIGAHNEPADQ